VIGWLHGQPTEVHEARRRADRVPEEFKVECHGARLAYNIHDRFLAKLQPCVLDFDGERFVFVKSDEAE